MGAWLPASFDITEGKYPDRVLGMRATRSFFDTLGVQAQLGRTFLPEDEHIGSDRVVLLSDRLWRNRSQRDRKIVGSTIALSRNMESRQKYTVIGVLPPSFQAAFPTHSDMWSPMALNGEEAHQRNAGAMYVIGRLRPGVSFVQADESMRALAFAMEEEYPETNRGWSVTVIPFHTLLAGDSQRMLWSLAGAVAFVLLIGCANLANLTTCSPSKPTCRASDIRTTRNVSPS
jgi:hypothetical protein